MKFSTFTSINAFLLIHNPRTHSQSTNNQLVIIFVTTDNPDLQLSPGRISSLRMCKEMNAPVLPESKKVNATVIDTIALTGRYRFVFDEEFTDAIQMKQRKHACLCRPSKPMMHFCCPGCLEGRYIPGEEDRADFKRVIGGYDFNEQDPVKVVDQILDLMARNMPLTLYSYGRGYQSVSKKIGILTVFFTDIESVHLWAGHIIHACEDYYYHEEYLHTVYHGSMYDADWDPIKAIHDTFGRLQATSNRLHNRLMMSYLGGGVGVGYIEPHTPGLVEFLEQDRMVETACGIFGVYLAAEDGGLQGVYKAKRSRLVPHEPIAGEVVKWSREWAGDVYNDDDDSA